MSDNKFNISNDNNFVKRVSLYLHDCVREEVQSSTFRNLNQDKDNKWIFLDDVEQLFKNFPSPLILDGKDHLMTELMLQGSNNQKDKYLIYGYLFLVGKNSKTKRKNEFLTPILYSACTLERKGVNLECSLPDEGLSLNTAALTSLMNLQEDEIDNMLDGLMDVVPKLPLKEEDLNIFLTTLKSLMPDIEIEFNSKERFYNNIESNKDIQNQNEETQDDSEEEASTLKTKTDIRADKIILTNKSAIILTKRPPVSAGVLFELTQIADKPSGTIRETSLSVINEEYLQGQGKMPSKIIKDASDNGFISITPLQLSTSQENVIKNLEDNTLLSVYGPPGTGKSQTIVNLVCHLAAKGKTVLIVSKMDKATDVLADRLNSFGVPFLALRAGRNTYQKELSLELQDLISGKTDIDSGYEESILVDIDDMKKLIEQIKDKENKCEELLKLEEEIQGLTKNYNTTKKIIGKAEILKHQLELSQIELIDEEIKKLEAGIKKPNPILKILGLGAKIKIKQLLKLKTFDFSFQNIERLKLELYGERLFAQMRAVENKIQKAGDINILLKEIKILKNKRKQLAIDVLRNKRRNSLKELLRDQVKRQRLIIHTKALTTKKQNLQYRLLEDEDFKPLLEAFPCWCTTSYAISNSLPLKPGMFDVAIIDEASQCDIASCIPVLYRCKKAVIVGDDKQLPHLSFLEKSKEQSFLSQYEIPDKYQLMWRFRTNSMFDLANYYSLKSVMLDEHYRSAKSIIDFSNKEFYGGKMKIMTNYDNKGTLEFIQVKDAKVDFDATRNPQEVEAIMTRLQELIKEDEENKDKNHKPVTIGIISPFRGQVELIKKALFQLFPYSIIKKHEIEVGTAHTFQGDERDIIMLSWAIADNSFSQSLTFLQSPNLFNVAITRAKKKQIVFLSKDIPSLPSGLLKDYIEYVCICIRSEELENNSDNNDLYKNDFEKELTNALREENFEVRAGKIIAGMSADLYVKSSLSDKPIVIECDGIVDWTKTTASPMKKQELIERTGIQVERISYREWQISKQGCIDRIKSIFKSENND